MIDFNWQTNFGYYFTYFGEVYFGIAMKVDSDNNSFYIVGRNKHSEYTQQNNTPEFDFNAFGFKIDNPEIIVKWAEEGTLNIPNGNAKTISWNGGPEVYKKMYVFGAGASTFCQFGKGKNILKKDFLRPPLGNELIAERFKKTIAKYPGVKSILPKFESNNNQIESILENDWLELLRNRNISLSSQHIQLQYFVVELMKSISEHILKEHYRYNLYTLFVDKCIQNAQKNEVPIMVSFNYDTILDRLLEEQFRFKFNTLEDYTTTNQNKNFILFKPHGSSNWGWEFKNSHSPEFRNDNIADYLYDRQITPFQIYYEMLDGKMLTKEGWGYEASNHEHYIGKYTPNKNLIKVINNEQCFFPALLLPYRDKDEFVMPYNHQTHLETTLSYIEELVLIGWKGSEKIFNKKLNKKALNLKKITIVNPDSSGVKREIKQYLDFDKLEIKEYISFEEYILNYDK